MDWTGHHGLITGFTVSLLLLAFLIANFSAQDPRPSPSSSPQVSPEPSPNAALAPKPLPRIPTPTPYPGAQNAHQWGSITVFNGLPSDGVRAIAQTPDGVMWFGTDNGLARFDGRRVQKVPFGGPEVNAVTSLKTLPTGELLVGSRGGAWVQVGSRFEIVANTQGTNITTMLVGTAAYIGNDDGNVLQLARADNGSLFATLLLALPLRGGDGAPLPVTGLAEFDGKLLVSTSGRGVFTIAGGTATELPSAPRPVFVNSLSRGPTGELWVGAEAAKGGSGVFVRGETARAMKIAAPTADVSVVQWNEGGLWAGTERYGLFHFKDGKLNKTYTFANTSGGLRSDNIFALFTDREGVLWIGTNRGVSRFDRIGPAQQTVSDIPNSNFVRSLFRAREDWTLAGTNRGLFLNDGKEWRAVPGFDRKVVHAIAEHRNATLMIGTAGGLFAESGRIVAAGDFRGFANLRSGTYAAVFGRGLVLIPAGPRGFGLPEGETDLQTIFPEPSVTTVAEGKDRLWIGTATQGLYSFDGKTVRQEATAEQLGSGTIWKMRGSPDGDLWIAGQHGVFSIRNGQSEKVVGVDDVRDIWRGADGHLWAATATRGVMHARRDERFGWLASSIAFEQGLPSEKAFAILPLEDGFLFATNRGVVRYRSSAVPPKLIPVRLLSQRVHDVSEIAIPIVLDHPQNSLLVEVAGQSSRTFPEEFLYAYVLTNSKGEAIDTRVANDPQYAPNGLPPGDYAVEITAFDRDLNPSEPIMIRFTVGSAPFPWTATALGSLLALALFALAWAIVEHRRIKQRNYDLAAARFDLANEAERERRRIARDLHDQTLADLRNLMMNSDGLAGNGSFRSEIESVSTEIRRICEDLSPSVLENVGLVAALEFLLSRTVEHGRFQAGESAEESITFPLNVQLQIYRIAQEVLTNISKHSDATAVELAVCIPDAGRYRLSIRDNGKSFQPAAANGSGRGVTNIRSRASLIGAKVKWEPDREWNLFTLELGSGGAVVSAR